jgi:hypothetical protein
MRLERGEKRKSKIKRQKSKIKNKMRLAAALLDGFGRDKELRSYF